jgi:hypothetical protein
MNARDDLARAVELDVITAALPEHRHFIWRLRAALASRHELERLRKRRAASTSPVLSGGDGFRRRRRPSSSNGIRYPRRVGFGRGGIDAFFKSGASGGV